MPLTPEHSRRKPLTELDNCGLQAGAAAPGQGQPTAALIPALQADNWDSFFTVLAVADVPTDFLDEHERNQGFDERDPFDDVFY